MFAFSFKVTIMIPRISWMKACPLLKIIVGILKMTKILFGVTQQTTKHNGSSAIFLCAQLVSILLEMSLGFWCVNF